MMGNILQLSPDPPPKFGFERARKPRKGKTASSQLGLFTPAGQVLPMASGTTPFERALHYDEKDDARAGALYREAIAQSDSVPDAYCNLGIIESTSGNITGAFDCFTNSLKADPRHLESHYNLANLYFDMEDLRLARSHYQLAAEIDPGFPNLYFNLGLVLALLGDFDGALLALTRYAELAPDAESAKATPLIQTLRKSIVQKR